MNQVWENFDEQKIDECQCVHFIITDLDCHPYCACTALYHISTCANQCTCCDVIPHALCYAHTYPVATQKGVADFYNATCKCMCIPVLKIFCYVAIA